MWEKGVSAGHARDLRGMKTGERQQHPKRERNKQQQLKGKENGSTIKRRRREQHHTKGEGAQPFGPCRGLVCPCLGFPRPFLGNAAVFFFCPSDAFLRPLVCFGPCCFSALLEQRSIWAQSGVNVAFFRNLYGLEPNRPLSARAPLRAISVRNTFEVYGWFTRLCLYFSSFLCTYI